MDNFFDSKRIWPGGGPYPHFLILFDRHPEYRAYARAHADLLSSYDHLGVIPEEWLHATPSRRERARLYPSHGWYPPKTPSRLRRTDTHRLPP
jgi:hypothetical protein